MRLRIFLIILAIPATLVTSAQSVTLRECYNLARENHPHLQDIELYQALADMKTSNDKTAYLPKMDLSGQVSYQSDVPRMVLPSDVSLPFTFPEISKDWYKLYVDIQQTIYDGGITKSKKELEEYERNTNLQKTEVTLYQAKQLVNASFFSILYFKNNYQALETKKETLEEQKSILESAVRNGTLLPNERDNVLAEILLSDQQITQIKTNWKNSLNTLNVITGQQFDEQTNFMLPNIAIDTFSTNVSNRPEIKLFTSQRDQLEASRELMKTSRMPKVFGFAQLGYGRPGLNMLDDSFTEWYLVGVGLKWNIWDWKQTRRKHQMTDIQSQLIESGQMDFERSQTIQLLNEMNNIQQFESLLELDEKLYELRKSIADRSDSQFKNGAITSADYIRDLNKATVAGLTRDTHKIELVWAKLKFLYTAGIELDNENIK